MRPNHRSSVSMFTNSTTFLTLLWFASCTSLVTKHTKLVSVFLAFCGSFFVATPIRTILSLTFTNRSSKQPTTSQGSDLNDRAKNFVGFCACIISYYCLLHPSSETVNDPYNPFGTESENEPFASFFVSNSYLAFSILTGYLTFDLWYTYLAPTQAHLWQILENAATLILLLTLLSTYEDSVSQFSNWMTVWLTYRGICHAMAACGLSLHARGFIYSNTTASVHDPAKDRKVHRPVLLSDIAGGVDCRSADNTHNLWMIHGQSYDLQNFVERHPGGKEAILLGRGRDCTALVDSYHPFSHARVWKILDKYRVSSRTDRAHKHMEDPFYEILCERVDVALREKGIDPIRDRGAPCLRVVYYFVVLVSVLLAAVAHIKGSIVGSFTLAIFGWLMGALGHDAGHFAVSQKFPWINDVGVWGMSLLCNPILWQHQHTYAHHSHTNEFDHDPDLHHFHTLLRVHWKFRSESIHKYQAHWPFVMLAYALVVFGTCFWIPWGVIQSGSLYGIVEWTDRKRFLRSVGMMLHTFGYVIFIIVVPFWTFSSWCGALSAVTIHVAVAGIIFAIFSQINHLNEPSLQADAEGRRNRPNAERDPVITNSWAAAQVETSNNFCPNSTLWHLLSNGLNLQIEHHLFPGLNHSHLHHIAPVVRQTCIDFGVVYKSYDSWSSLMCATLEWLKTLSHECDADVCRQE